MVLVMVDLDDFEDKFAAHFRIDHGLVSKADAVRLIVRKYAESQGQ